MYGFDCIDLQIHKHVKVAPTLPNGCNKLTGKTVSFNRAEMAAAA